MTTSTTTAATTSTSTTATGASVSASIFQALGTGSGIDTNTLAQNLANAEIAPQQQIANNNLTKSQATISSYGTVKNALNVLETALTALKDESSFNSITASSSQPAAFSATTDATAKIGNYGVAVTQLAQAQTTVSTQSFSDVSSKNLTGSLTLSVGSSSQTLNFNSASSVTDVVNSINNAGMGVTAQLVDSGNSNFSILLTGQTGAANAFTISSNLTQGQGTTDLSFSQTDANNVTTQNDLIPAQSAVLYVNGFKMTRNTNTVGDAIPGVTLTLNGLTSGSNTGSAGTPPPPAQLTLTRDNTSVVSNFQNLVTAYNAYDQQLSVLANPKDTTDTNGGALADSSFLQNLRQRIRSMLTANSSTASGGISTIYDVGLSFDASGQMTLDANRLNSVLQSNYSDVVKTFTGNSNNRSIYLTTPGGGIAGDSTNSIDALLRTGGLMDQQINSEQTISSRYQTQLDDLQTRLQQLITQYTQQFSVMNSLVGQDNSLKSSLQTSFNNMLNQNKN